MSLKTSPLATRPLANRTTSKSLTLAVSLTMRASFLRQGEARTLRVATTQSNPRGEDHHEGQRLETWQRACASGAGLHGMTMVRMRGDGESETFLRVWNKPNMPAPRE